MSLYSPENLMDNLIAGIIREQRSFVHIAYQLQRNFKHDFLKHYRYIIPNHIRNGIVTYNKHALPFKKK